MARLMHRDYVRIRVKDGNQGFWQVVGNEIRVGNTGNLFELAKANDDPNLFLDHGGGLRDGEQFLIRVGSGNGMGNYLQKDPAQNRYRLQNHKPEASKFTVSQGNGSLSALRDGTSRATWIKESENLEVEGNIIGRAVGGGGGTEFVLMLF